MRRLPYAFGITLIALLFALFAFPALELPIGLALLALWLLSCGGAVWALIAKW